MCVWIVSEMLFVNETNYKQGDDGKFLGDAIKFKNVHRL